MTDQQPTKGQNKRSRKGCLACIQSKVKCDETHPVCRRCDRTKKQCAWPEIRPSLRVRRRGLGPYKDRSTKNLQMIVPASDLKTGDNENNVIVSYTEPLHTASFPDVLSSPSFNSYDHDAWNNTDIDAIELLEDGLQSPIWNYILNQQYNQASFVPSPLEAIEVPSSSSVIIRKWEWEALQFFERVFARIYSPKPFRWSVCAIFAQYGKNHGAIQHLIIAVCLGQLDQTSQNRDFWQLGKKHYQAGARLIMQEINGDQRDHCKVFVAFWLIQATYNIYWSDRVATNLAKLSQGMAQYTRRNQLTKLFTKGFSANQSQELANDMSEQKKSLLGRLMLFCFYEDIDADFCHAGGSFAAEIYADNAITDIYIPGSQCLSHYFEASYPQEELMDDVQRVNILNLHFSANLALYRINASSKENPSRESFEKIARQLQDLKSEHSATFRLAKIRMQEYSKVSSCANNVVAHFLAVETYNLQYLSIYVKDDVYTTRLRTTIQDLLFTIGNLCGEYPMNMPYRNQWLFFIACIGTADPIHIAWISDKLKQGRYFETLQKAMDIQRSSKVEMSIHDVRSLFWGLGKELLQMDGQVSLTQYPQNRGAHDIMEWF